MAPPEHRQSSRALRAALMSTAAADALLDALGEPRGAPARLLEELARAGLHEPDPRVTSIIQTLERLPDDTRLDEAALVETLGDSLTLVKRAVDGELIIPDFSGFSRELRVVFDRTRPREEGKVAAYIPQLARVPPAHYGAAVCSIDGQQWAAGDAKMDFTAQSCMKPINYCIALEELGEDAVHGVVGREPSGRGFNELTLNDEHRPHNPMINAGAIAICSLIKRAAPYSDRFDHVMAQWQRLAGGQKSGFSNAVYLSERDKGDRNYALGYFMKEKRVFPDGTDLLKTLEFYFQCCSIEVTCERMAIVAATLANGGVCPLTGERVLLPSTVRSCLSLMYSSGMYDFSGEFAFSMGLPAKSGVSGGLMIVVPNVLGLCTWSPRLDPLGNSVRGLAFCEELVSRFTFHIYDGLLGAVDTKRDPTRRP